MRWMNAAAPAMHSLHGPCVAYTALLHAGLQASRATLGPQGLYTKTPRPVGLHWGPRFAGKHWELLVRRASLRPHDLHGYIEAPRLAGQHTRPWSCRATLRPLDLQGSTWAHQLEGLHWGPYACRATLRLEACRATLRPLGLQGYIEIHRLAGLHARPCVAGLHWGPRPR